MGQINLLLAATLNLKFESTVQMHKGETREEMGIQKVCVAAAVWCWMVVCRAEGLPPGSQGFFSCGKIPARDFFPGGPRGSSDMNFMNGLPRRFQSSCLVCDAAVCCNRGFTLTLLIMFLNGLFCSSLLKTVVFTSTLSISMWHGSGTAGSDFDIVIDFWLRKRLRQQGLHQKF